MTRLMKLQAAGCIILCVAAIATAAHSSGVGTPWTDFVATALARG